MDCGIINPKIYSNKFIIFFVLINKLVKIGNININVPKFVKVVNENKKPLKIILYFLSKLFKKIKDEDKNNNEWISLYPGWNQSFDIKNIKIKGPNIIKSLFLVLFDISK